MRKMNFLTVIAILFVGALSVKAQDLGTALTCPGIQTLDCSATADPFNPMPGQEYTYEVNVTPDGGKYNWIVTTNPNFIESGTLTDKVETASGDIILAAGAGYNDPSSGTSSQKITWKAAPATGDLFLVLHYTAADDCANDNLKVYKINMLNNFAIDVYNIASNDSSTKLGSTTAPNLDVCPPKVQGAKYEGGAMVYDYGTTYLYYAIAAGNFVDSWNLQFKVDAGLQTAQEMTVSISDDGTSGWEDLTVSGDVYSKTITGNTGFNESDCVVVRVAIKNNTHESLADQEVKLVADATSSAGKKDVSTDCTEAGDFAKGAIQKVTPRPTVTNNTTGGDFVAAK